MLHSASFTQDATLRKHLRDYLNHQFYIQPPTIANYGKQIRDKQASFTSTQRQLLTKSLRSQYNAICCTPQEQSNIQAIGKAKTFTVTTGHQLCLATGPAYFIYKILNTIKLAQQLAEQYPEYNFVPIYWAATEDHDFKEIQHCTFGDKTYRWSPNISEDIPVGRIKVDKDLQDLILELDSNPFKKGLAHFIQTLQNAYKAGHTLSHAMRILIHELFGKYGVLMIDGDEKLLKNSFKSVIEQDVLEQKTYTRLTETQDTWQADGYRFQIPPREVNFFLMQDGQRQRVDRLGDNQYEINSTIKTKAEIATVIEEHPELFSPNVALRPVCQEWILPNLAYIGGAAEIGYWLPLVKVFEAYNVPFPQLHLRSSLLKLDAAAIKLLDQFDLLDLVHQDVPNLCKQWTTQHENISEVEELHHTFSQFHSELEQIFASSDSQLIGSVKGHAQRISNQISALEKKVVKHYALKNKVKLDQLHHFKSEAYTQSVFQERKANYFSLYSTADFDNIIQSIDAFDPALIVH